MAGLDLLLRTWRVRSRHITTVSEKANRGQFLPRGLTIIPVQDHTPFTAAVALRTAPRPAFVPIPQARLFSSQRNPAHFLATPSLSKKKELPEMSPQQREAVKLMLTTNDNIIITAVAGAGKTTTTLHLAAAMPDKKFVLMVYNRRLMDETNDRAKGVGRDNIEAFNYHSLGNRYYPPDCPTDEGLKCIVQQRLTAIKDLPDCDVLVLDEQQDMTPLFFLFIRMFACEVSAVRKAAGKSPYMRFVLMGDPKQELYGYKNADSRFLTLAGREELFGQLTPPGSGWHQLSHTTSYRMTPEIVDFINQQVLKPQPGQQLVSGQDNSLSNPRPRYLVYNSYYDPLQEVLSLLESGLKPDQILILTPSTKNKWALTAKLANELALRGIPIFVTSSDEEVKVTEKVHRGKLLISTYHQAKGIERDAAIVYCFDQSYNEYYNRNPASLHTAENPMYVAVTRAKKHLVLLHNYKMSFLPFLNPKTLGSTCELVFKKNPEPQHDEQHAQVVEKKKSRKGHNHIVTDLLSYLPERVVQECIALLKGREVSPRRYLPRLELEIEVRDGLWESVADITGTAIPAIYEWRRRKSCKVFSNVFHQLNLEPRKQNSFFRLLQRNSQQFIPKLYEIKRKIKTGDITEGDILYLANVSLAMMSGYIYKVLAIPPDGYTWFTPKHTMHIYSILNGQLGTLQGIHLEKKLGYTFKALGIDGTPDEAKHRVTGQLDICRVKGERALWELKLGGIPRAEHYLQAVLYAAIMEGKDLGEGDGSYNLVYLSTGQVIRIQPKYEGALIDIVRKILEAKAGAQQGTISAMTDEEFLAEAGVDFTNVVGKAIVLPGLSPGPESSASGHEPWKKKLGKKSRKLIGS